ncbi:hypothetical protein ES703_93306 [subsurface metagenome]
MTNVISFPILKMCKDCGGIYHEQFFNWRSRKRGKRQPRCILCEKTKRDNKKRADRWLFKAVWTLTYHAKALHIRRDDLIKRFGWNVHKMARDAERAYKLPCHYCGKLFEEMRNGLADITLVIDNINKAPVYDVNTRWACNACNGRKGKLSPSKWHRYLQHLKAWKAQQKKNRERFKVLQGGK